MKWDFVSIEDLVDDGLYISDGNYSAKYPRADEFVPKGIPFIRANNLSNHSVVWDDMRFITPEKHEILQKGHLRTNDVLITTRGNIGTAGIVPADFDGANINAQLVLLRCEGNKIDPHYLIWVFSLPEIHEQLNNLTTGTALQQLPVGNLLKLKIPLPPLTEQKRIASLLARADRLRHLRRTAHELGESLLQSVFLEMFGDPISNSKHWEQATIKELGKVVTGSTPPSEVEGMFGGYIPFITPGDLTVDTLKSQRYVTEEGAKKSRVVRAGSTLVCCIGATIGKTDIAKTKCAFNQQINAIEWDENIQDDFGLIMMTFFSRIVAERGISTTLPILKKSEFEEIVIPVPPLNLQEEFAGVVARVESLRGRMSEGERQVEGLFESLLEDAFDG